MATSHRTKPSRRVFMCTECHKAFRSREELYMHAELCLLEAFELEASNMLADMPDLHKDPSSGTDQGSSGNSGPPLGMTIKTQGPDGSEMILIGGQHNSGGGEGQVSGSEAPPMLHAEKPTPGELKRSRLTGEGRETEMEEVPEMRKPLAYTRSKAGTSSDTRTIQTNSGLKLMVSVERPDDGDDEEEYDDDMDEDVSVPGMRRPLNEPGMIMGALANATEEDMYKPKMECPTCGLVLYRHNFSTHYRIHTGEMPFHCSYCDKRFRTTSALKVHVRAHTGEKPYVCPRCNYACITKRNLDRHIINNHVREGVRRGPRYRRSRYRLTDPHHEEYLMALARESHEEDDEQVHIQEDQLEEELEAAMLNRTRDDHQAMAGIHGVTVHIQEPEGSREPVVVDEMVEGEVLEAPPRLTAESADHGTETEEAVHQLRRSSRRAEVVSPGGGKRVVVQSAGDGMNY